MTDGRMNGLSEKNRPSNYFLEYVLTITLQKSNRIWCETNYETLQIVHTSQVRLNIIHLLIDIFNIWTKFRTEKSLFHSLILLCPSLSVHKIEINSPWHIFYQIRIQGVAGVKTTPALHPWKNVKCTGKEKKKRKGKKEEEGKMRNNEFKLI